MPHNIMSQNEILVQQEIKKIFDDQIQPVQSFDDLRTAIENYIADLIQHNFHKLISILYRVDVDEEKLKKLLKSSSEKPEVIITNLLIERQFQKIKNRYNH